jgi:quercetin dioxygenase-like cupin family protein
LKDIRRQKISEDLAAKALKPTELVQTQPGAIVSREIMRSKTGTVTVFAFDKDEELSEHTVPFDALVLALEGEADVAISGTPHRVKAGEMIIMPAGEPHALKAVGPFKMALIMIRN